MKNHVVLIISTLTVLLGAALAQTPISYTLTNDMAEYTTVYIIEVGDVPGHILRTFELVWSQAENDNPPIFNGIKVEKIIQRSFADYINFTGSFQGYDQYVMENGDVIYGRNKGTVQTELKDDGSTGKTSTVIALEIIGGTGAFEGIRGLLRASFGSEPAPGATFNYSGIVVEGSYWIPEEVMGSQ